MEGIGLRIPYESDQPSKAQERKVPRADLDLEESVYSKIYSYNPFTISLFYVCTLIWYSPNQERNEKRIKEIRPPCLGLVKWSKEGQFLFDQ